MKILEIMDGQIRFDNGYILFDYHRQDCCESVYAYFQYLKEEAGVMSAEFPENLEIETVEGSGFRIVDVNGFGYFVPCYDRQNGYYSSNLSLTLKGEATKEWDITGCTEADYD